MKMECDFREFTAFASQLQNVAKFEEFAKRAMRDVSKALLKWIKSYTPVDTYELINGWDDASKIMVVNTAEGFEVKLMNKVPYALSVNDGHRAFNQFGGPYQIHNRVQVRSPHKWQRGDPTYYVFGHFFVERGIVRMKDTKELENLLYKQLEKWWEGCLNG